MFSSFFVPFEKKNEKNIARPGFELTNKRLVVHHAYPGLSSLGVPGVPRHTQILEDQLTLFQPGGTDYAHLITTGTPGFSDLPTAL
jgi:hypothetical protein